MKINQSCNTLQAIRQRSLCSPEPCAVRSLSSSAVSHASRPINPSPTGRDPRSCWVALVGASKGMWGLRWRGCGGTLRWAVLDNLMKTTTLSSVNLRTCIKSWMRPPSTCQRRWWGKLVSCCIHYSLLPIPPPHYIPRRTTPHPTSPEKHRARQHEWGIVMRLRHGSECFHFHLIRRRGC